MMIPIIITSPNFIENPLLALHFYFLAFIIFNAIAVIISIVLLLLWFKSIRKLDVKFGDALITGRAWNDCLLWRLIIWRNLIVIVIDSTALIFILLWYIII